MALRKLFKPISILFFVNKGFPGGAVIKTLPANAGDARDLGLTVHGVVKESDMTEHAYVFVNK